MIWGRVSIAIRCFAEWIRSEDRFWFIRNAHLGNNQRAPPKEDLQVFFSILFFVSYSTTIFPFAFYLRRVLDWEKSIEKLFPLYCCFSLLRSCDLSSRSRKGCWFIRCGTPAILFSPAIIISLVCAGRCFSMYSLFLCFSPVRLFSEEWRC